MTDHPQEPEESFFTAQELREHLQALQDLSDEDLEAVAGGGGGLLGVNSVSEGIKFATEYGKSFVKQVAPVVQSLKEAHTTAATDAYSAVQKARS